MMNKVSITSREIYPIESYPAIIQDYKLTFFSEWGMACAEACKGESFHGVIHKVKENEMKKLDKIESIYKRIPAKATPVVLRRSGLTGLQPIRTARQQIQGQDQNSGTRHDPRGFCGKNRN